jgi:hypothetical protein
MDTEFIGSATFYVVIAFSIIGIVVICGLGHSAMQDEKCEKGGTHDWKCIDRGHHWRSEDLGFGIRVSGAIGVVDKCSKCGEIKKYDC